MEPRHIIVAVLILVVFPLIRFLIVYSLPLIYHLQKKVFPLNSKETKVCWYSGMVRGVIAFALSQEIQASNSNITNFIKSITVVIVIVTTLGGATFLKTFANCIGLRETHN